MKINNIKNAIVYDTCGIDLIKNRRLKEIVSPNNFNLNKDEEIFICDKKHIHGILILNKPSLLDKHNLNNRFKRHLITEELIDCLWTDIKKLNVYSFRIKKIFKNPIEYRCDNKDNLKFSKLIKNIEIIDRKKEMFDKKISDYKAILVNLKSLEVSEDNKELRYLFLNLFSLMIDRMEKRQHPGTECPDGFIYDPKTQSCVKIKPKRLHGNKRKPKKIKELINA